MASTRASETVRAAAAVLLLCSLVAAEPVIYSPFAANLESFPTDTTVVTLEGAEIHKASGAQLPGMQVAGTTMNDIWMPPCSIFQPHYQPGANEMIYIISGNVTFAVVDMQTNEKFESVMGPGDMGVMPQGYVHYLANTGCEAAHILGVFTTSNYTRVSLAPTVAALGPAVTDEMFGASADLEAKPAALIAPLSNPDCQAACKV